MSGLAPGMRVTGLTVSRGTEPDALTGEYVGKINDGIAPGVDMLMVKMSGSEITDPDTGDVWRGIWAGMSGSPVYAPDGRLIGAVAYGLAYSPSAYAGVTPAAEMYRVGGYEPAAQAQRTVKIPTKAARQLRAEGDVTQQSIQRGYRRLPMPLATSGVRERRMQRLAKKLDHPAGRLATGSATSAAADPIPIEPGGNLVASLSYGDITQAATGTATAICAGEVLGFGHPMALLGRSTYSMHGAAAVLIETDVFGGSFKVANPAGPSGQITQDRLAGILGVPGNTPPATTIDSHVEAANGNERDGTTTLTETIYPDDVAWISAMHLLANEDRVFDAYAEGTANVRWAVNIERPNGSTLRYTRSNTYANSTDITYWTIDDVYADLYRITSNPFVKVRVTDVDQAASLDEAYQAYRVGRIQRHAKGRWMNLKPGSRIRANADSKLVLRARLVPQPDSAGQATWRRLRVPVGAGQAGRVGRLTISGGASTAGRLGGPKSLPALLRAMKARPRNDQVHARLEIARPRGTWRRQDTAPAPSYTEGRKWVTVRVRR